MGSSRLQQYEQTLTRLRGKHRQRTLSLPSGIDFTSNDYLALANSPRIKMAIMTAMENGVAVGAGGSRLLRGNHDVFAKLETEAAAFFHSEKALYFSCGYSANMALFATLPQRADIVFHDEYVHASILDGIAAGRAQACAIRHNDVEQFSTAIQQWRKMGGTGRPWIAVESIYSMDGDRAPLTELYQLAQEYDGFLVIDEAHATGVFGDKGRGLACFPNQDNVIVLHTCGKALGVSGALLCLNRVFCDYLINRARAFIYSTAPSPLIAAGVCEALNILKDEPQRRAKLHALYAYANKQINILPNITGSGTQILPVLTGNNQRTMYIANRMQQEGFDIRAIRPPTVPEGTARLRISISLHVTENDIQTMFQQLLMIMDEEQS